MKNLSRTLSLAFAFLALPLGAGAADGDATTCVAAAGAHAGDNVLVNRSEGGNVVGNVQTVDADALTLDVGGRSVRVECGQITSIHQLGAATVNPPRPPDASRRAQTAGLGAAGTFELGGLVSFQNSREQVNGSGDYLNSSIATLSPTFGYYLGAGGAELLGQVSLLSESQSGPSGSGSLVSGELGAGAGYFAPVGTSGTRIGPSVLLLFGHESFSGGDGVTVGPGAQIGLTAKVPIGGAAALNAGLAVTYERVDFGGGTSGTLQQVGSQVGFSVLF